MVNADTSATAKHGTRFKNKNISHGITWNHMEQKYLG